jgi:hypothetical protein
MENKSNKIAIIIGVTIGVIFGIIASRSMIEYSNKYEMLVKENKMLKDMLYEEQNPQ